MQKSTRNKITSKQSSILLKLVFLSSFVLVSTCQPSFANASLFLEKVPNDIYDGRSLQNSESNSSDTTFEERQEQYSESNQSNGLLSNMNMTGAPRIQPRRPPPQVLNNTNSSNADKQFLNETKIQSTGSSNVANDAKQPMLGSLQNQTQSGNESSADIANQTDVNKVDEKVDQNLVLNQTEEKSDGQQQSNQTDSLTENNEEQDVDNEDNLSQDQPKQENESKDNKQSDEQETQKNQNTSDVDEQSQDSLQTQEESSSTMPFEDGSDLSGPKESGQSQSSFKGPGFYLFTGIELFLMVLMIGMMCYILGLCYMKLFSDNIKGCLMRIKRCFTGVDHSKVVNTNQYDTQMRMGTMQHLRVSDAGHGSHAGHQIVTTQMETEADNERIDIAGTNRGLIRKVPIIESNHQLQEVQENSLADQQIQHQPVPQNNQIQNQQSPKLPYLDVIQQNKSDQQAQMDFAQNEGNSNPEQEQVSLKILSKTGSQNTPVQSVLKPVSELQSAEQSQTIGNVELPQNINLDGVQQNGHVQISFIEHPYSNRGN